MNQVADDVCTRYVYNRSAFISDRFVWQEERIRVVPRNHSSLIWDGWFLFCVIGFTFSEAYRNVCTMKLVIFLLCNLLA